MKRPKITDFTPDYTKNKGALYVQYTIAQDKYIDYLENEVEKLNLLHVSKHRELLIAFCRFLFTEMNYTTETEYAPEEQVDVFIESNFHNIEFIYCYNCTHITE